jgi:hypothetical protein
MSAPEHQAPSPARHYFEAIIDFTKDGWFYVVCLVFATFTLWRFAPYWTVYVLGWILLVLVSLCVISIALLFLWHIPRWQTKHLHASTPHELFELENEARRTFAQILGGLLLLFSLYFTWDNFKQTQESTQRSIAVAREGQITDRFNKAIAQLDEEKLQIRLGGVYALERISRESETDRRAVVGVLLAHLHQKIHIAQPQQTEGLPAIGQDIKAKDRTAI